MDPYDDLYAAIPVVCRASSCNDCAHGACRSFFQQLMVAVDFCHAMGIRIQDLRPHNMLLVEHNDAPSLCRCVPILPATPMHLARTCPFTNHSMRPCHVARCSDLSVSRSTCSRRRYM